MRVAYAWLSIKLGRDISPKMPGSSAYHPMLTQILHDCSQWRQSQAKREAYTFKMLRTFAAEVAAALKKNQTSFRDAHAAIFNLVYLGLFTGS